MSTSLGTSASPSLASSASPSAASSLASSAAPSSADEESYYGGCVRVVIMRRCWLTGRFSLTGFGSSWPVFLDWLGLEFHWLAGFYLHEFLTSPHAPAHRLHDASRYYTSSFIGEASGSATNPNAGGASGSGYYSYYGSTEE